MGYLDQYTEQQRQVLRHDPRQFVANSWRHPNRPEDRYDFKNTDGTKQLDYLLHDDGPLNPESWGNINILMFGRGALKSTTLRMVSNWVHHMFLPWGVDTYMTAPREDQVTNFTEDLEQNFGWSGLERYREKDNRMHQMFEVEREDERGDTYTVKSSFMGDSGWGNGDALRGPHTHFGIIDEVQDISKEAFDTYVQCIDQEIPSVPYFPSIFLIGTPKLTGSFYHDIWQKSDQKSWDASDGEWVQQSEAASYSPDEETIEELGIDPSEIKPKEIRGWHVDQYNSPTHDPSSIARDKANSSDMKFANENLAQFYSPEDNLLSRQHVAACFDEEAGFKDRRQSSESFVTLTADWGGGHDKNAADTVFVVTEHTTLDSDEGSMVESEILNLRFLESGTTRVERIQDYEEWLLQYDVDLGVIDYGHDEGFLEDIQDGNNTMDPSGYRDRVKAAKFGNVSNKTDIKWESDSGFKRFFTCDKTRSIVRTVDAFKHQRFTIPKGDLSFQSDGDNGTKLMNQLTAPYKDMVSTPGGTKKIRVQKDDNRNDDAMDAFTYAWLAYHEIGAVDPIVDISMTKRSGYA